MNKGLFAKEWREHNWEEIRLKIKSIKEKIKERKENHTELCMCVECLG